MDGTISMMESFVEDKTKEWMKIMDSKTETKKTHKHGQIDVPNLFDMDDSNPVTNPHPSMRIFIIYDDDGNTQPLPHYSSYTYTHRISVISYQ